MASTQDIMVVERRMEKGWRKDGEESATYKMNPKSAHDKDSGIAR